MQVDSLSTTDTRREFQGKGRAWTSKLAQHDAVTIARRSFDTRSNEERIKQGENNEKGNAWTSAPPWRRICWRIRVYGST